MGDPRSRENEQKTNKKYLAEKYLVEMGKVSLLGKLVRNGQ